MKVLSDNQVIELATVDDAASIAASEKVLSPVIASAGLTKNWLSYAIKEGFYQATDIKLDGVPVYRFFWHINDQKFVEINFSLQLCNKTSDKFLWAIGADMLARKVGARGIGCVSRRRGMVQRCVFEGGWKIIGVRMEKVIYEPQPA
jgi:hypothetical protein